METPPLNIYLKREIYDMHKQGKSWQLWRCGGKYNEGTVFTGRELELFRGQSGESRQMVTGGVVVGGLQHILSKVSHDQILPGSSRKRFEEAARRFFGDCEDNYIAFEELPRAS